MRRDDTDLQKMVMMAAKYVSPADITRVEMNQLVSNALQDFTQEGRCALSAFKEGTPQKYLHMMEVPAELAKLASLGPLQG